MKISDQADVRFLRRILFALIVSTISTGGIATYTAVKAGTAQTNGVRLDTQSVKKLFPGHYEARFKGYKVMFSAHRDGRLVGQAFGREDRGRWFVRGSRVCMTWKQWTKGKSKCGSISRQGNWLVASNKEGQMLKFRPASVVALNQ